MSVVRIVCYVIKTRCRESASPTGEDGGVFLAWINEVRRIKLLRVTAVGFFSIALVTGAILLLVHRGSGFPGTAGDSAARAPQSRGTAAKNPAWPYVRFSVVHNVLPQGLVGVSLSIHNGGLFAAGGYSGVQSVTDVRQVFPRQRLLAQLTIPTHDAASSWIGANLYLFGGGQATSYDTIVQVKPPGAAVVGQLAMPLSDAGMTPYAGGALLIGGHNGNAFADGAVLYTRAGPALRAKALFRLPVGLRYAGVAVSGKQLWILGGRTRSGMSREIYHYAPGFKRAEAVGRLPIAIDKAAAWAVPGYVLIAGGQTLAGVPQKTVYAFNELTRQVRVVGSLPSPMADMGYASDARGTYLVGGATAANLAELSRNLMVIYTTWFR